MNIHLLITKSSSCHFLIFNSIVIQRNHVSWLWLISYLQMEFNEKELRREISYAIKNIHGIRQVIHIFLVLVQTTTRKLMFVSGWWRRLSSSEQGRARSWEEETGDSHLSLRVISCIVILAKETFSIKKKEKHFLRSERCSVQLGTCQWAGPCSPEPCVLRTEAWPAHEESFLTQRHGREISAAVGEEDWERRMKVVTFELNLACRENKNHFNRRRCAVCLHACACVRNTRGWQSLSGEDERKGLRRKD